MRLPHCKANERSPAGINKRREGECARARVAVARVAVARVVVSRVAVWPLACI